MATKPRNPTSNDEQKRTKPESKHWLEYGIFFFVILTTIGTGGAAYYARQQWITALDSENRQTRAYVFLRDIQFQKRNEDIFDIIPEWENTGNSETVGMQAYLSRYMSDVDMPPGFTNGDIPATGLVPIILGPKSISTINFSPISGDCLSQFNRRDDIRKFYIWGWTKYGDTLTSDQHVTRFCWDIDQIIFSGKGKVSRVSHSLCNEGNCADKDCGVPTQKLAIAIRANVCKSAPPTEPPPSPTK